MDYGYWIFFVICIYASCACLQATVCNFRKLKKMKMKNEVLKLKDLMRIKDAEIEHLRALLNEKEGKEDAQAFL